MGVLDDFIQNNPEARVLLEGRVGLELASSVGLGPMLLAAAPRGDGHPVLVMPGWMAGDASTVPLRGFLRGLGYRAHGWGLGRNRGPEPTRVRALEDGLLELADRYGEPVSLIGWSLGGLYARELAALHPDRVRCWIALASPLRTRMAGGVGDIFGSRSRAAHAQTSQPDRSHADPSHADRSHADRPPATAIYSRSDGVVRWRGCLTGAGPRMESLEIESSHCGMGHHPTALWIIADRLAQRPSEWRPFDVGRVRARLFGVRSPSAH